MTETKRYIVVDPAKQEVTRFDDYRGQQHHPKRPLLLECDFCGRMADRLWCTPVRAFGYEMAPRRRVVYDGGHWCACVFCKPLLADATALLARVTIVNPATRAMPASALQGMWAVVSDATEGPAVEWNAGDVWPVAGGK